MRDNSLLSNLAAAYELMDVRLGEVPAHFSVALPADCSKLGLPKFPYAATPESGRIASGRGLDQTSCHLSCLGEAVELLSCCLWGDEKLEKATIAQLGKDVLTPQELLGLSDDQYDHREEWNSELGFFDWRPRPATNDEVLEWVEVHDAYTGRTTLAPADFVFIGKREAGEEAAVAIADSNGCASGPDIQQAKLSAVLELIERDALARWWYGLERRNVIELNSICKAPELMSYLLSRKRISRVFDITSDLKIPTYAAVSCEEDGSDIALGSAAGFDATQAILSALTEMLQMEITLETARKAPGVSKAWDQWRKQVSIATEPFSLPQKTRQAPSFFRYDQAQDPLPTCLEACMSADISLFFVDITRASIAVPTFRALSTTLCHYKPRFGRRRLLNSASAHTSFSSEVLREQKHHLLV